MISTGAFAYEPTPPELQNVGINPTLGRSIPLDLSFTADSGQRVSLQQYFNKDKPVLIVLAYYECPMLCTLVLNGVNDALKGMNLQPGRDFSYLVLSINPAETAALAAQKKQSYLDDYGHPETVAGWHWMVGDEPSIARLAGALGFQYRYDPQQRQYAHGAGIFVLTPRGKLSQVLYGIEFKPRDLRLALIGASEGSIGSPLDRLTFLCYHYDPATRQYTLYATRLMQAGGILTLLILGSTIAMLWLRERRRPGSRLAPPRPSVPVD